MERLGNKLDQKKLHGRLRAAIQTGFFLLFPSAFTAAFSGIKYVVTQMGLTEQIAITPFVTAFLVLCIDTIVFGRFFCGFACAFGSMGDGIHTLYVRICKKCRKKAVRLPQKVCVCLGAAKYPVLFAVLLACFMGMQEKFRGTSPWELFSMLRAGNWRMEGYGAGILLFMVLLVGMCVEDRFFCRFFCPMGAVFSLLPQIPLFALRRDKSSCIKGCSACARNCPATVELPDCLEYEAPAGCFQCQKCIDICPKGNIRCNAPGVRGNGVMFTLFRAAVLAGLFVWAGL